MKYLSAVLFIVGLLSGLAFTFGSPPSPQPIAQNGEHAHFDVQIHNRDNFTQWDEAMAAQHGANCAGPPATHVVSALGDSVFICNDHLMTALWAHGYGMIALTPSQLLDCSASCTVQFDLSTERLSTRDWPDLWLTPWADNLTLPFDEGDVDLQGVPRQGIHVNLQNGDNNAFHASTIANYVQTGLPYNSGVGIGQGIATGTNQAAVRQTLKLTVTPGHLRFERLASATATAFVWVDADCACLMASDYVVQFGHHSYNPTKPDDAGVPSGVAGTWHWFGGANGLVLNPATPFTLIHASPTLVTANNSLVTFDSPAPANAYLRFSGVCQVMIDGAVAPKQTFLGHVEHASAYFIPIAQGKQSVSVSFAPDAWYGPGLGPGCGAQDFAVWSKGGPPSTPTATPPLPTSVPLTSTASPSPTSTPLPASPSPTPVFSPTATRTPVLPTATGTPKPAVTCNQAYFKNHVLTEGAVIPCP